jgi:hypothetical protein
MATDKTFTEIRQAFQAISGISDLESYDQFFFLHSLNRSAHKAWSESEIWPRYMVRNEERAIVPTTAQGETRTIVAAGWDGTNEQITTTTDNGFQDDDPVKFIESGGLDSSVDDSTTYYVTVVDDDTFSISTTEGGTAVNIAGDGVGTNYIYKVNTIGSLVPLTEHNKDTIAEFHRIQTNDPYTNSSTALEVEFIVDDNGARIINPSSRVTNSVWVDYKKIWDGPYTEASITIPEEFADYIIHSALADFYSGDGQTDKSMIHAQRAEGYLALQLGRLSWTNRNPYKYGTYMTHTNHQRRY